MPALYDAPGPGWYEPVVGLDDDEVLVDPRHPELFILSAGVFWWTSSELDADDED